MSPTYNQAKNSEKGTITKRHLKSRDAYSYNIYFLISLGWKLTTPVVEIMVIAASCFHTFLYCFRVLQHIQDCQLHHKIPQFIANI